MQLQELYQCMLVYRYSQKLDLANDVNPVVITCFKQNNLFETKPTTQLVFLLSRCKIGQCLKSLRKLDFCASYCTLTMLDLHAQYKTKLTHATRALKGNSTQKPSLV